MFHIFYILLKLILFFFLSFVALVVRTDDENKEGHLQIIIMKQSDKCRTRSTPGDLVHLHFVGKLRDGTVIEDTYPRKKPLIIRLGGGQVIKGLEDGLVGMCVGEIRNLTIPASMAYGTTGIPPLIPPNAILLIKIELVEIEIIKGQPEPYLQDFSEQKESNSVVVPFNVPYDRDVEGDEETITQRNWMNALTSHDPITGYNVGPILHTNLMNIETQHMTQTNDANYYKVPSNTKGIRQYNTKDRYTGDGSQNADEMNYDIGKQTERDFKNNLQIESEYDKTFRHDYHNYKLRPDIKHEEEKTDKGEIKKKVGQQDIKKRGKLKVYTDYSSYHGHSTTFMVGDPLGYEDPKPKNMELPESMKKEQFVNKEMDFCSTLYREDQDKELNLCRQAEDLILLATAQLFIRDHLVEYLKEMEEKEA